MALVASGLAVTAPAAMASTPSAITATSTPPRAPLASSSSVVKEADARAVEVTGAAIDRWNVAATEAAQNAKLGAVKTFPEPTVLSEAIREDMDFGRPTESAKNVQVASDPTSTVNNPVRGSGTASISGTVQMAGSPDFSNSQGVLVTVYIQSDWVAWVAYTYSDKVTGAYALTGIPAGEFTLKFQPNYIYHTPTQYAWEWWGNTYTQERATAFNVTTGQAVGGMNITLPVQSTVTATLHLPGAPAISTSLNVWSWDLLPDTGDNGGYSIAGGQAGLNGGQDAQIYADRLPAGDYKICVYMNSEIYGPYPYGYGGSVCSPGHASSSPGNFQGPYFTVPASSNVTIDVGSMPWPTVQGELDGGSNPSESFCECNRGDPIDTMTGTFTEDFTDLTLPGVGPPESVVRHYSSADAAIQTQFGNGWQSPLSMRLVNPSGTLDADTQPQRVNFVQENGSIDTFYQSNQDYQYAAASRIHAALSWDYDALQWTVVRNNSATFRFDPTGLLLSETDADGNTVLYGHDASNTITSIAASGSRSIALTYAGALISSATDSSGRAVSYAYDTDGNLTSVTDPTGAVTTYGYAPTHLLTTVTKPGGGVTTNTYDSSNRVTTQLDPMNRTTTLNYSNGSGKTIVTSPDGSQLTDYYVNNVLMSVSRDSGSFAPQTTSYTYDQALNIASVTDPLGNVTTSTYDANANQLTRVDPLGNTTTNTYDARNNKLTTTDPLGRVTVFTYNAGNHPVTQTLPSGVQKSWTYGTDGTVATSTSGRGKLTGYGYDSLGRRTTVTDADARTKSIGYDAEGFINSTTDSAGNVSTLANDVKGRILSITDPNSQTTTYTYDVDGNQTTAKDAAGKVTTTTWDAAGERTTVKDPLDNTTTWAYAPSGQVSSETDPLGHATAFTYNGRGLLDSVTDGDNHVTTYGYDGNGNQLTKTLPSGNSETTAYDANGRKVGFTDAAGKVTTFSYDAANQEVGTTDPLMRTTSYGFTVDGLQSLETLPGGSTVAHTYDAGGNVTLVTNADGKVTTYGYDDADLRTSSTLPGGLITSYDYDAAGRLQTVIHPDGATTTTNYDPGGRLTRVHSSATGITDVTYTYDAVGRRAGMADVTGTATYTYDAEGRLTAETNGAGFSIGYGYDAAGRTTTISYPGSHTVTYGYDNANQMTSAKDWLNHKTTFTYNADSRVAKQTSPSGIVQTNAYDAADRLTTMTAVKSSKTVAKYSYGYDDAGEMTSDKTVDPSTTTAGIAHTYTYDTLAQLASATKSGITSTYTATAAGVLSKLPAGVLTSNTAEQLTKLTPTSGSATTFTYNANGERSGSTVGTATAAYIWAANGAMAAVALPGSGGTVNYTSDGDGLRQTRKLGTKTAKYLWSHGSDLSMLLDDGTNSYIYGPAGQIIEQIIDSNQVVQYLFHDLLGSVRLITSSTGTTAGTYTYDPYGKQTGHTGTSTSGLGYTGNLTDTSTGLLYLRARDYDPGTGQFMSADPLGVLTRQIYSYAANNPLMLTDFTGLWSWLDTLTAVGIGIGMVALALTGVGAFVDIGIGLTALSVGLGVTATAIDTYTCVQGEAVGCAGAVVNGFGAGLGGLGLGVTFAAGSEELAAITGVGFARALFPYVATGFGIDAYGAGLQFNREYGSTGGVCR